MLDALTKVRILAVHAAVSADSKLQETLLSLSGEERRAVESAWAAIGEHRLLRKLAQPVQTRRELDLTSFEQADSNLRWQGCPIGAITTRYKSPLPEEWQARIAHESFLDRFVAYLQREAKVLLLADTPFSQLFYVSDGNLDLDKHWKEFVKRAFSAPELIKTFVALLNSVRLSARGGFSVLQVPVVSKDQALLLAALYAATLEQRRSGDLERRHKRQSEKLEKQRRHIEEMQKLLVDHRELKDYARAYDRRARQQLKVTENVVSKCVSEVRRLLETPSFYDLPPLLSKTLAIPLSARPAGDHPQKSCYVCGRDLSQAERFKANKFIAPSPSQALQSHGAQKQPFVCGVCAALSIASPIKLTDQAFAIRLRDANTQTYLLEDQLRMFLLGDLGVAAGRYAMLVCTERLGDGSLLDALAKVPYALWKVATLFPADVFRAYRVEAVIDGAQVKLPSRQLAWLSALMEVFNELRAPHRLNDEKSKLNAVKKAIRYVQEEELLFAIYELTKALKQGSFSALEASRLEDVREQHVWWLENDPSEQERSVLMNKSQLFRDVAGLTGILYAFVSRLKSEAKKSADANAEREVKKLIEKADEPCHFIYDAAGGLPAGEAKLWRKPDTHFIYDQAKALLEEAQVEVREGDDGGAPALTLSFDDLCKAYTHLFDKRYTTEKDQRAFTYQVKLSLYARFPEYLGG